MSADYSVVQHFRCATTRIVAVHHMEEGSDTLWLKALDYGAHCLVTPEVGGGKDRRIAHEFGHAVGMVHPDSTEFGTGRRTIMSEARYNNQGFIFADSVYADSSKLQFSTKRR